MQRDGLQEGDRGEWYRGRERWVRKRSKEQRKIKRETIISGRWHSWLLSFDYSLFICYRCNSTHRLEALTSTRRERGEGRAKGVTLWTD